MNRRLFGALLSTPLLFAQNSTTARTIRVLTNYPFTPEERQRLSRSVAGVQVDIRQTNDWTKELSEAEVIFGQPSARQLAAAPKLKWIQVSGAGVEWMDDGLRDSNVVMTNMAGTFAPGIADTGMGLLLSLTRRIHDYQRLVQKREWKPMGTVSSTDHTELSGRTMGIIGFGGIGQAMAKRAHFGFDMRIIATDAKPLSKPDWVSKLREPDWHSELIKEADVVVLAAPLTGKTRNLMNEAMFRSMKKTAFFIALSRGGLFDDTALVKALKEGWIAGAGLDVFPMEPIPSEHPIYDCPNVVITPHTSGWGPDRQQRLMAQFEENLRRYANGLPLQNVVDKKAGY
jgi:phosphoglycerate dehydrogenase-like enzyme